MSDPKELEDKLKHVRAGMEKACAGIQDARHALQSARPHLRDLLAEEAYPINPDVRAATITSLWHAIDVVKKDLHELDELRLELLRDLSRLSG
jgi:hypothetical protein